MKTFPEYVVCRYIECEDQCVFLNVKRYHRPTENPVLCQKITPTRLVLDLNPNHPSTTISTTTLMNRIMGT